MLDVSNESREKNADDPPVESLDPWLPRGKVQNIGSFTMFVFTYFGEMWVLIHKLNKTHIMKPSWYLKEEALDSKLARLRRNQSEKTS